MKFYSYAYLTQQNNHYQTIQRVIIAVVLVALAFVGVMWYRHRSDLKYRDLLTIMTLIFVFLIGLQVNEWRNLQSSSAQKSQATQIMQRVAQEHQTSLRKVWSNTANAGSGMLVIVDKQLYTVTINSDGNSFSLTAASPMNQKITYIDGGH